MLMLMQMQCNYGAKHLRCYKDGTWSPRVINKESGEQRGILGNTKM
jgi:hypothetical protein